MARHGLPQPLTQGTGKARATNAGIGWEQVLGASVVASCGPCYSTFSNYMGGTCQTVGDYVRRTSQTIDTRHVRLQAMAGG